MAKKHEPQHTPNHPPPPDPPPPDPAEAQKRAPSVWAAVVFPETATGRLNPDRWQHAAADALHGWSAHEHHHNGPLLISESDYKAALQAAKAPKGKGNHYTPHAAACSPAKRR